MNTLPKLPNPAVHGLHAFSESQMLAYGQACYEVAMHSKATPLKPIADTTFGGQCSKHPLQPKPCKTCAAEAALIAKGICPECEGEGEQGGQFCGGYWKCEACGGSGKTK